jgi:hypothetical protein
VWIMTTHGMFSAVEHKTDPNFLVVRSRVKADARHLAQFIIDATTDAGDVTDPDDLLVTYEHSDYPWRVIMYRDTFGSFLATEVHADHLNYGNYKDAVKAAQGPARAAVYSRVWTALLSLQDQDPERERKSAWQGILDRHWDDDLAPYEAAVADDQEPDLDDEPWIVTLECGCRIDMDADAMVEPCKRHQEAPF